MVAHEAQSIVISHRVAMQDHSFLLSSTNSHGRVASTPSLALVPGRVHTHQVTNARPLGQQYHFARAQCSAAIWCWDFEGARGTVGMSCCCWCLRGPRQKNPYGDVGDLTERLVDDGACVRARTRVRSVCVSGGGMSFSHEYYSCSVAIAAQDNCNLPQPKHHPLCIQ